MKGQKRARPSRGVSFRILEHTADVGIEAEGTDLGEALGSAALGLVALVTGRESGKPMGPVVEEVSFTLEAPDRASAVVAFLSELLWILESRNLLWAGGGATVEEGPGLFRIHGHGNAVRYDPSRHGRGVELKAVTYHGLEAAPQRSGRWRVRVFLDI